MSINIHEKNLNLDTKLKEYMEETFYFLKNYSEKEITLRIEKEKDCFKLKIFFDINKKDYIAETRSYKLKDGIYRLKNKTNRIISSELNKFKNMESIRTIKINNEKKKEYEFKHIHLNSIDKPVEEKDAKKFLLENKLDIVMFININKDYNLSILQRKKNEFYLYITNYEIN